MTGQLMRRLLSLPAPIIRGAKHTNDGHWLEPGARQLNLSHPTGWLAADPSLTTFECAEGQIHYQTSGSSAFAVGIEGARADLIGSWASALHERGYRRTLIFPVAAWQRSALERQGFDLMQVGEEAEVYLPSYQTRGKKYANLRQMLHRAQRQRLSVELHQSPPADPENLEGIWREHCAQTQRMSLLVGQQNVCHEAIYVVVRSQEGQLLAWVEARPGFASRGYGVDGMVRHPNAPAGAIELAIDALLRSRRQAGDTWLSLGAVPLRGVDLTRPVLGLICRTLRESGLGNRLFHFSGLGQFKAKFEPNWRPVLMADYKRLNAISLYEGCRLWGLF